MTLDPQNEPIPDPVRELPKRGRPAREATKPVPRSAEQYVRPRGREIRDGKQRLTGTSLPGY